MSDLATDLKQSAANRAAMVKKFGLVPTSLLKVNRGSLSRSMFLFQQEQAERGTNYNSIQAVESCKSESAKTRHLERQAYKHFNAGGGSVSDKKVQGGFGRLNASTMPAELVEFFAKYYARPGDVYMDPFMGQGVRMQVAKRLGLHYYGYDLSTEFFAYIDAVRHKIDDGTVTLSATCGDSRYPTAIPDGIGDFCFTSPPYWDIEFYGTEPGQLGYQQTYEQYLAGMEDIARAWLPKFKAGAWYVCNVNDFRKDGRFYPCHADTLSLFQRAGWVLYDLWIIEGLVGGLSKAFAVSFNMKRIAPKVHEYALVFRKP